jgi:hypothetical protein
MLKRLAVVVLVLSALALVFSCQVVDDTKNTGLDVTNLRLTTSDISNWAERVEGSFPGYAVFVGNAVCDDPIDGACGPYTAHQVVKTILQYMGRPSPVSGVNYKVDAYVMDFGTPVKAKAMFDDIKPASGTSMSGYADSVVIMDETTPNFGVTVYANFGKFYIELKMDNYTVKADAIADAKLFIDIYAAKIGF